MTDNTFAPRRRPLWGLFIVPVLVLIAAAAWSAFWFYAASEVGVRADAWRAQEAKSGRVYDCAKRTVAGFPFRFEVRCDGASVALVSQTASNTPFTAKLGEIRSLLISDTRQVGGGVKQEGVLGGVHAISPSKRSRKRRTRPSHKVRSSRLRSMT